MIDLQQGDCLKIMKNMPDKSVDLIVTDPPYGIGRDKGSYGFGIAQGKKYKGNWDKKIPSKQHFDEMLRISKNCIIFGGNYFAHFLPPSKHWIFWDKKGNIKFKNPFADGELIYTTFDKVTKKITFLQQGFISDSKDIRVHPTQKPTELLQQIINTYSRPYDVILDCFMGSGSTGVACVNTNRNFIGMELDEHYFEVAKNRIDEAIKSKEQTS